MPKHSRASRLHHPYLTHRNRHRHRHTDTERTHTHTHTLTHAYTHARTHARTHTHTQTRTHTSDMWVADNKDMCMEKDMCMILMTFEILSSAAAAPRMTLSAPAPPAFLFCLSALSLSGACALSVSLFLCLSLWRALCLSVSRLLCLSVTSSLSLSPSFLPGCSGRSWRCHPPLWQSEGERAVQWHFAKGLQKVGCGGGGGVWGGCWWSCSGCCHKPCSCSGCCPACLPVLHCQLPLLLCPDLSHCWARASGGWSQWVARVGEYPGSVFWGWIGRRRLRAAS
jgi:hypothetical protein